MRRRGGKVVAAVLAIAIALAARASESAACASDCNADARVDVAELVTDVRIAHDLGGVETCPAVDSDGDRQVTTDELKSAVNAALDDCPVPRLVALSREGDVASLEIASPWQVRASGDLDAVIASARCRAGRCLVVQPDLDSIAVVRADDLSRADPIQLERAADPRDVVFVSDDLVVASQYGKSSLVAIDLTTHTTEAIDLSPVADEDGLPEALRMARCGRRLFVQVRRVDHDTESPSKSGAGLAVIDLDRSGSERLVDADPETEGVQPIALAERPDFDMPVDCGAGVLYVSEPRPVLQGGSRYEQVDLTTLTASDLPLADGAEAGGIELVEPGTFWLITHTDFGPGASSHLNLIGGTSSDTYNTFSMEHVDDLALDREEDLLFFPDNCTTAPGCDSGIHAFHAHSGERASADGVDVGFPPVEVVVSR